MGRGVLGTVQERAPPTTKLFKAARLREVGLVSESAESEDREGTDAKLTQGFSDAERLKERCGILPTQPSDSVVLGKGNKRLLEKTRLALSTIHRWPPSCLSARDLARGASDPPLVVTFLRLGPQHNDVVEWCVCWTASPSGSGLAC